MSFFEAVPKNKREFLKRMCEKYDLEIVDVELKNHLKVWLRKRDTQLTHMFVMPVTGSDYRGLRNTECDIRSFFKQATNNAV